ASIYEVLNDHTVDMDTQVIMASNDDRRLHKKHKRADEDKPSIVYHKVTPGQNLSSIADQYNVEVQDLKVWNKLRCSTLVPGQKLIVSKGSPTVKHAEARAGKKYISYRGKSAATSGSSGRL
ncbi:MAG TPA: LysM peptidoglycan-binding domain-containing protein, partial [Pedobacter sp.]